MRGDRGVAGAVTVAALQASGGGAVAADQPPVPPTLNGESFHQDIPTITAMSCRTPLTFTYLATDTASGPYSGTFTVRGAATAGLEPIRSASFTIDSPVGRVTGISHISNPGISCARISPMRTPAYTASPSAA